MPRHLPGDWFDGIIPDNVSIENGGMIETSQCFERFRSRVAEAVRIREGAAVYQPTQFDLGEAGSVSIGRYALLNGPRIICDGHLEIGDYALIAWNVVIMDTYRLSLDQETRREQLRRLAGATDRERRPGGIGPIKPVVIEANTWIGFDAVILPGVTVREGSIVAARSVVCEDVPAGMIVAGNPARVIRQSTAGNPA